MKYFIRIVDFIFDLYVQHNEFDIVPFLEYFVNVSLINAIPNGQLFYLKLIEIIKSKNKSQYKKHKNILYTDHKLLSGIGILCTTILVLYFFDKYLRRDQSTNIKFNPILMRFHAFLSVSSLELMSLNYSYNNQIITLLKDIISFCNEFDLQVVKFPVYEKLNEFLFSNNNKMEFEKYDAEYISFRDEYNVSYELSFFIRKLALSYRSQVYQDQEIISQIKDFYNKFTNEVDIYKLDSSSMYFYFLLKVEYNYYFEINEQFTTLSQYEFFLNFNRKSIGDMKYNSGINNLILNYFIIGNTDAALKYALKHIEDSGFFIKQRINLYLLILNHVNNLNDSIGFQYYLKRLNSLGDLKVYSEYYRLFLLNLATHLHLTANYKDCQLALNEASPLLTDKSGFGLGIRILEILNFIKWDKKDQVETALLNLKNHIAFLKNGGKIKPRYLYIYKILVKLHSYGYDYKETFRLHKEKLHQMNGDQREYAWEFRGPELLRFDLWFFDEAGFLPPWNLNDPRISNTLPRSTISLE